MTKTSARLALVSRQRRFEWALARDEQARAAARMVAGKTHDLLNLIQIVRLAGGELERCCDASVREILDDLQRTADASHRSLIELMAVARPAADGVRGAPVGAAARAAVASLEGALEARIDLQIEARIEVPPEAATRCTAEELEHLVLGLALDAADAPAIELAVRTRTIDDAPWIELVRGYTAAPGGDRFELRAVEAIARRAGGELATSARRRGGEEVIVALPEVP